MKYSSILAGALVAGSYIMGHLPTYLHVVRQFTGYWVEEFISEVKLNIGAF